MTPSRESDSGLGPLGQSVRCGRRIQMGGGYIQTCGLDVGHEGDCSPVLPSFLTTERDVEQCSRVPIMVSLSDVESLIHTAMGVAPMERPSPNTMAKLKTALRRLDPERQSEAWEEIDAHA